MACNELSELAGSLSGGCVEDDFIERITQRTLPETAPVLLQYGMSAEENERLGLPCGGRLRVLVEPFPLGCPHTQDIPQLLAAIRERRCLLRSLDIHTGLSELSPQRQFSAPQLTDAHFRRSFGPRMQMLLIGAGHMSRVLAEMAMAMDYHVLVCDPRPHMREQWTLNGVTLLADMPDDAVRMYASDALSIVITLTHDPRFDDMALMEALTTDAFYIGALGSMRTTGKRLERLQDLGITPDQLQRLHAPVGLDIGSKTAMEIAISILAEITRERHASVNSPTANPSRP